MSLYHLVVVYSCHLSGEKNQSPESFNYYLIFLSYENRNIQYAEVHKEFPHFPFLSILFTKEVPLVA